MSSEKRPSVKKDLQATADLLNALQNQPGILEDADFIERLSILRQRHEETTNFLAKRLGAPPIPKMTTSTSSSWTRHQNPIDDVPCDNHRYHCTTRTTSTAHRRREEEHSTSYHAASESSTWHQNQNRYPTNHHQPVRTAPAPPESPLITSSSSSRQTIQLQPPRRTAATSSHLATSSVAMPTGLLLSNSITKHTPSTRIDHRLSLQNLQNLATSSHVVEESFLEDGGLSTTREIPTIVDEMVEVEQPPKKPPSRMPKIAKMLEKKRSKSMQNVSEPTRHDYIPQTTIPKPFQLSLRKHIGNTYAKKFMSEMMDEKKRSAEVDAQHLKTTRFKAKPVPKSTYQPTNTFATEMRYVESMRKKVAEKAKKKFDAQNEMVRSKSEGNLASVKPLGYVPPSTYISPIPVKPNARSRSATTRSAILIQEATTPKGIKSHRHTSNLTHHLRHGRCKLDTSTVIQHRRISPPDFPKLHAKINEEYRKVSGKPSTVPVPFKFASRSQSASTRHTNCGEKEPQQFRKSLKTAPSSGVRVPSTHAAQLREELSRARVMRENAENGGRNGEFWKEDNRKRIATFLGSRSKTEEDIAIRTRRKIQQQQETTQEYMRQLAQMKQRVLNGPLIMEKQSALAQEHRLKRKFEQRMKSATAPRALEYKPSGTRRNSDTSGAGTFVVEKEYTEEFEEEETATSTSKKTSRHSSDEDSEVDDDDHDDEHSEAQSEAPSTSSTSSASTSSSSTSS